MDDPQRSAKSHVCENFMVVAAGLSEEDLPE